MDAPEQIEMLGGSTAAVGKGFTLIETLADAEHPAALVAVTLYVPAADTEFMASIRSCSRNMMRRRSP